MAPCSLHVCAYMLFHCKQILLLNFQMFHCFFDWVKKNPQETDLFRQIRHCANLAETGLFCLAGRKPSYSPNGLSCIGGVWLCMKLDHEWSYRQQCLQLVMLDAFYSKTLVLVAYNLARLEPLSSNSLHYISASAKTLPKVSLCLRMRWG